MKSRTSTVTFLSSLSSWATRSLSSVALPKKSVPTTCTTSTAPMALSRAERAAAVRHFDDRSVVPRIVPRTGFPCTACWIVKISVEATSANSKPEEKPNTVITNPMATMQPYSNESNAPKGVIQRLLDQIEADV